MKGGKSTWWIQQLSLDHSLTYPHKYNTKSKINVQKVFHSERKTRLNPGCLCCCSVPTKGTSLGGRVEGRNDKKRCWNDKGWWIVRRGSQRVLFLGLAGLGCVPWRSDGSSQSHTSSSAAVRIQFLICWLQNLQNRKNKIFN